MLMPPMVNKMVAGDKARGGYLIGTGRHLHHPSGHRCRGFRRAEGRRGGRQSSSPAFGGEIESRAGTTSPGSCVVGPRLVESCVPTVIGFVADLFVAERRSVDPR